MVRYTSKSRFDNLKDGDRFPKVRRFRRKHHVREFIMPGGLARQERHHGWGYIKHRVALNGF